ncbi:MAG: secretin N-terminal domain-containing protein [Xanthomonadales bacterium]|nr:secretin N-terminal domain-containing protein [Xanthomonadales bacterium]
MPNPRSLVLALVLTSSAAVAQEHRLNIQDGSIQSLVSTVAEITGRNFVLDPRVDDASVNIISNRAMTEDEIYELFLSVLKVHGFAAVPSGEYIKIMPDAVARQDAIPNVFQADNLGGDQLVTQVIEVQHVTATELVTLLRPLVPQNGHIIAHQASNVLVVSDRAANVNRLAQIIRRIDTVNEDDIEVIALSNANATEVVRALNQLVPPNGQSSAAPKAIADERTNSVLLSGDPGARLRLRTIISHLDTPIESGGATQVVYLRYASAESLLPILEGVSRSLAGAGEESPATIQAHDETNAVIITAPPAVYRSLAGVIRQLDIRRLQVMVEAVIAEVSNDFSRELGVQWQAASIDSLNDSGPVGGTNFRTNAGTGPGIINLTPTGTGESGLNLSGLGPGLNLGYLSGTINVPIGRDDRTGETIFQEVPQLSALVSAIDANADNNVLSTPSIVTLDHQEAVINVGQEVPFVTGQFTNTGANNSSVNPFQTITREDVGLTLTVTPHINAGETVILDISQEISSISPQALAVDLITNKREISTTVMVPDGGVLVLGGLIDDNVQETIQKVPGLGDIPVLGNLFRYRNTQTTKRNLMVFIRPRILQDEATQNAVTGAKYNFMRSRQQEVMEGYQGLAAPEALPLLPTLEEYRQQQDGDN